MTAATTMATTSEGLDASFGSCFFGGRLNFKTLSAIDIMLVREGANPIAAPWCAVHW